MGRPPGRRRLDRHRHRRPARHRAPRPADRLPAGMRPQRRNRPGRSRPGPLPALDTPRTRPPSSRQRSRPRPVTPAIRSPAKAGPCLCATCRRGQLRHAQPDATTRSPTGSPITYGQGNWKIIRYAEALREEVAAVLAPMGLRLAPEKTAVVHLDEGFTFLGFDIRRMRKRGTQKYYVYTKPSKKAIQAIKDKVRTKTYRSTRHMGLDELIASLNRSLAGWASYFRHGVSKAVFSDVDIHAWK